MCGEDSRGNGDGSADEKRQKCKLQRGRIALKDDALHRRLEFQRVAQIAVRKLPKIMSILSGQGQIQPQRMAHLHEFAGSRAFAEHLLDRVAGNDVDHEKHEGEHQPEGGQSHEKALEEVAQHSDKNQGIKTVESSS